MNRRGFLQLLGAAAAAPIVAAPALDLGRRIFLPPRGGWPASSLVMFTRTVDLDEYRRKYLEPAMRTLVAAIEVDMLAVARDAMLPALSLLAPPVVHVDVSNDGGRTFRPYHDSFDIELGQRFTIEGVRRA